LIDLHTHVLPGLDDGPPTLEAALAMAAAAVAAGCTAVAATPHVDRRWSLSVDAIEAARATLVDALREAGVPLEVAAGGEIALDRLVDLDAGELARLALGATRTLLVECPLDPTAGDFTWPVRRLLEDGWSVLLAHPERSPAFQRDGGLLERLVDEGARAQVTAAALTGDYGSLPREAALSMLDANLVHVIASDAHDGGVRGPDVEPARLALAEMRPGLIGRWAWLTRVTPQAILSGMPVPARLPVAA
jgi:protein-tyrosine phosphatase